MAVEKTSSPAPAPRIVARGRSVHTGAGIIGPGGEVSLDAEETERLTILGFLVPLAGAGEAGKA